METENVEIIKALVRTNLGITIMSFQSVAREFASGQLFCARIAGQELLRRTGWVYAKANRVPARRPGGPGGVRAHSPQTQAVTRLPAPEEAAVPAPPAPGIGPRPSDGLQRRPGA